MKDILSQKRWRSGLLQNTSRKVTLLYPDGGTFNLFGLLMFFPLLSAFMNLHIFHVSDYYLIISCTGGLCFDSPKSNLSFTYCLPCSHVVILRLNQCWGIKLFCQWNLIHSVGTICAMILSLPPFILLKLKHAVFCT